MAEPRENVLHVENVTMQFGGVVAVNNLSLDVDKGEIVALIGPNGAGKTTAFNVITGVYQPTNGRVQFQGDTIIENHPRGKMRKNYLGENAELYSNSIVRTPDRITKLGIARTFQNIRLFKAMTVFENVECPDCDPYAVGGECLLGDLRTEPQGGNGKPGARHGADRDGRPEG